MTVISYQEDACVVLPSSRRTNPRVIDATHDDQRSPETTAMSAATGQVRSGGAGHHPISLDDPLHGDHGTTGTAPAGWIDVADRTREHGVRLPLAHLQRLVDARPTSRLQLQERPDRVGLESVDVAGGRFRGGSVTEDYDEEDHQQRPQRQKRRLGSISG